MALLKTFKAVIINADRTSNVYYISKKRKIGANAFRPGKKLNEIYIIDPRYTIITTTKRLGVPFNYQTCYYRRNTPVAVPMNEMDGGLQHLAVVKTDKDGLVTDTASTVKLEIEGKIVQVGLPIQMPDYKKWQYPKDGISSEELSTLFDPQFYKMIARANQNKKQDQIFMMHLIEIGGIGFMLYYMIQNLPHAIVGAILKYINH